MLLALVMLAATGHGSLALLGCGAVCACVGALDVSLIGGWRSTGSSETGARRARLIGVHSGTCSVGPGLHHTYSTGPL